MSVIVPDIEQRQSALDPARSFIVQAPAGSGKTELLIQRYLLLLARVDHAEEIVAVTFTKKAAGEMRERVLQALADAQAGKLPASAHEELTLKLAAAALQRDREGGWHLADNPAQLRIQTIDALCAGLTRQMPVLSQFGSQPDTVEDASELHLEAARATVALVNTDDPAAADVETVLAHLDNDVARTETLLADMLARRDQWLRQVHGRDRERLEAALQQVRAAAVQRLRDAIPAPLRAEMHALAEYALGNLGQGAFADDVESWMALGFIFLTEEGRWRQRLTKNEGFPVGKPAQPWKERAQSLFAALDASLAVRPALVAMRKLPPPQYSDSQWQVLGAILRLLPQAVAQLKLIFQARRQVDFTEVAQGALQALGTEDEPTDLTFALDYRIRHLLIDEFQDTSISQSELIARLTAGWSPDDGRTVFAVGDPMQSIYRFREAEVGLFLRARKEGIGSVDLQPVALSANFRSQSGIVDWVNAAFAQVMPFAEDITSGAVPYSASAAIHAALNGNAVTVHALAGDAAAEEEAQRVAQIVRDARTADTAAKVAILVRTRSHLREIVPALKAAGLRFRAIDIEPLGQRPVIQDLLALTRALAHPADRVAWLAVLRAPCCGLTLADLHALAATDADMTLWSAMQDEQRVAQLSADGRLRLQRVRAALATSIAQRARKPLREQVAGAWYALGGPACVEQETDLEDAETYFRYLDKQEEAGALPDRAGFEAGLDQLFALPDLGADDSLQIMTIHKAKGLEFDVVIVPGLARSPRHDDKKLFLWTEQPGAQGAELLLAPINAADDDGDAIYAWIEQFNSEKQSLEDGRLLYVAATRAKRRLHLLGSVSIAVEEDGSSRIKPPPAQSLLGKLWPVVASVYEAALRDVPPAASPEQAGAPQVIDQTLRRLPAGWTLPAAPPAAQWTRPQDAARAQDELEFSWAGETARHIGSVVHRWLQRIAADGVANWNAPRIAALEPAIRHTLAAQGVGEHDIAAAAARALQALANCLNDERGRWVLDAHAEGRSEWRLTGISAGRRANVVIDRSFVDAEGVRWIIDYKTSVHEGADTATFLDNERERYRGQLERYAALLQTGGERQIRLGLYFPLLGGWREWEYADPSQ